MISKLVGGGIVDKWLYVMMIEKKMDYTKEVIERHVANLKRLDENNYLELCGPLKGYSGIAGMVILKAKTYEEADELCKQEPFVVEGYATYKLCCLEVANKENNYLL
jgi:uncharacterized protein YciI